MHQILAELYRFESFCKLFSAYCLEVIVCKFYFIILRFEEIAEHTKTPEHIGNYRNTKKFFFFLFA